MRHHNTRFSYIGRKMERKKSEANGGDEEGGNESHYDDGIGIDGNNDGDFLVIFLVMMMVIFLLFSW